MSKSKHVKSRYERYDQREDQDDYGRRPDENLRKSKRKRFDHALRTLDVNTLSDMDADELYD